MSQDQSTRVLLQIKDENIKNLSTKVLSDGVMRVMGELTYDSILCPRCGKDTMNHNGHKTVVVRLPRISERTNPTCA
ncbi:hypothetical protein LAC03_20280 [Levilactobacillus acidifarinae]|nr:hypothetical protein LAC03_20280 [Levilactobacillus acidifarinae]